ncbi:MAG: ABC transporter permease [Saprospiraceae bacterium]
MLKFILNRFFIGIISILVVSVIITTIIFLSPVDPARLSFGQRSDEETINLFKKKYYLDQSLPVQIFRFFEDLSPVQYLAKEDLRAKDYSSTSIYENQTHWLILKKPYFRKSFTSGKPVWEIIAEALPGTIVLALCSIIFSAFLGLFLGFVASLKFDTWIDRSIMAFCSLSYAIPSYVSALFIGIILAYFFGDLTGLPLQGSLWDYDDSGDRKLYLINLVLPVLALGIRPVSMIAQMTRAASLDVIGSDYIRTAKSKGLGTYAIVRKHLLPNCVNPILTTISSWLASLLTGSFFVEYVFNYKGLGLLTINALNQFDIPLITGCCIVTVCIFITINFVTDLLYVYFDPRIKTS